MGGWERGGPESRDVSGGLLCVTPVSKIVEGN